MDLDAVLPDVGEFGTYQQLLLWLVLLPAVLPNAFHAYNQLFMAARPDHWCREPALDAVANSSADLAKRISVPVETREGAVQYSQCRMFSRNYSGLFQSAEPLEGAWNASNSSADTTSCRHGWNFDYSQYATTVVTEWELVCDKDFYPTLALILFNVGGLVGNYIFGCLQDGIGRRPSFFIYLAIECVFGVATAFAQDFVTWTLLRVGVGFTVPAILATPYVLAIELVGPSYRTTCTILTNIAYSVGLVLLAGVVYLVRDWRQLALATSMPFIVFFLYWWVLPESSRWLLARGRFDEAEKILQTMARVNGKSLPANYMLHLKRKFQVEQYVQKKENNRQYGVMDLLRTPNLRRKTLIITFIWFTNTSVYVGLSYYAPVLGGDEFLNFFLAGAVELPTYVFLWPAMDCWGRRWTLCCSMVVGGVACLATLLVQNDANVTLVLYCVGKMGISSSFVVLPLLASELYPTVVRGLGMSISSVVGMLGPVFIPLVNYMGDDMLVLPLMVMGGLLVAGGVCSLLLPETLNQHLPQSLEDGEQFGRKWSWRDWISCCPPRVGDMSADDKPTTAESPLRGLVLRSFTKEKNCDSPGTPSSSPDVTSSRAGAATAAVVEAARRPSFCLDGYVSPEETMRITVV